jgi:hypothetical protein
VFGWIRVNVFPIVVRLRDIFVDAIDRIRACSRRTGRSCSGSSTGSARRSRRSPLSRSRSCAFAFVDVLPVVLNVAIKYIDLVSGAIAGILRAARAVRDFIGGIFRDAASAIERSGVYQAVEKIVGVCPLADRPRPRRDRRRRPRAWRRDPEQDHRRVTGIVKTVRGEHR